MIKHGMLTDDSNSDFDNAKKAEYFDADGFHVADEKNKAKLKTPVKIKDTTEKD